MKTVKVNRIISFSNISLQIHSTRMLKFHYNPKYEIRNTEGNFEYTQLSIKVFFPLVTHPELNPMSFSR